MTILLISNMYPCLNYPHYGSFVKTIEDELLDSGFNVFSLFLTYKNEGRLSKFRRYIIFYIRVIKAILKYEIDIVYLHYVSHCYIPILFCKLLGKKFKVISHIHGSDVRRPDSDNNFKYYISDLALRASDRLIYPSKSYAKQTMACHSLLSDKDITIYPSGGVQEQFFLNRIDKRVFRNKVGFAGRLVKEKNVDLIIDSILEVRNSTLEIVGEGPLKSALMDRVNKLDLSERVTFLPPKSRDELVKWFSAIDILVYPSSRESLGLVPLEAIATGCCVVLSDIPAFRELADIGVEVRIIDNLDSNAISDCIKSYILMPNNKRLELICSNQSIVKTFYSSKNVRKVLVSVFEK